ncbi:MAG TPA: GTP pyrophosphokinase family protein [Candidatus Coprocola pullicola]|nr:GTP pyrophosphokinase family protein [Candidatus Coprocola pullicola]
MQDLMAGERPHFDLKNINPEVINSHLRETKEMMLMYDCGIKEVKTKLEILNNEFQIQQERNPIEYLKSRVKSLESIVKKLHKKGYMLSVENAMKQLNDIAGIRVICSFIDDIYSVADMLKKQDDITVILEKDYIKYPKPNGYRSYHMVLEVPVFFSQRKQNVKVEVQIRTIAMDFWASLEHKLYYKETDITSEEISGRLKKCADIIADTDAEMQSIRSVVEQWEAGNLSQRKKEACGTTTTGFLKNLLPVEKKNSNQTENDTEELLLCNLFSVAEDANQKEYDA